MPAKDMAAYMRDRRARKNAEAVRAVAIGDTSSSIGPEAQRARRRAQIARIKAEAECFDGAMMAQARAAGERDAARVMAETVPPAVRPPSTARPPTPVRSMLAIGGKAGRGLVPQGNGYPAPPDLAATSVYGRSMSRTETMLAALASRSDMLERRVAQSEAREAERAARADRLFAGAMVGLRLAFGSRV